MTDLATLGLAIDSRQALNAASALDRMASSGAKAEAATASLGTRSSQAFAQAGAAAKMSANDHAAFVNATNETAGAQTTLVGALQASVNAHQMHATSIHGSSLAMQELLHISRSMVDGLAAGANPVRVLAQEFGRLQIALSAGGGVSGLLGTVGTLASRALTPFTVLAGGIGAATVAAAQWEASQNRIYAALQGRGRASGFTLDTFDQAALTGAQTANVSVTQARSTLAELVGTGHIEAPMATQLQAAQRQYARASGLSVDEAGKSLAQAFGSGDLTKGFDSLESRVGGLDDRTRHMTETFQRQGDATRAQAVLFTGLEASISGASTRMEMYSDSFTRFKNNAGELWNSFGENVAAALGDETIDHRINALRGRIARNNAQPRGLDAYFNDQDTANANKQLDELLSIRKKMFDNIGQSAEYFRQQQRSLEVGSSLRSFLPDEMRRQNLEDARTKVNRFFDPTNPLNSPLLMDSGWGGRGMLGLSPAQQAEAQQRQNDALNPLAFGVAKIANESTMTTAAITAMTGTQRSAIEAEHARTEALLAGKGALIAAAEAMAVWNRQISESNHQAAEAALRAGHEASLTRLSPLERRLSDIDYQAQTSIRQSTYGVTTALPGPEQARAPTLTDKLLLAAPEPITSRSTAFTAASAAFPWIRCALQSGR